MTLLVATQDPNATAETYVRQHMRRICPGRTVGLGLTVRGEIPKDLPFLSVALPRNTLHRKLYLLKGRLQYGFAGAPVGEQRFAVVDFLHRHGVRLVLAEFGPTGAALRAICKAARIPLVVNFHGYDANVMPRSRHIRNTYRLLARDAAGIVCGSFNFRRKVLSLGFTEDQVQVIPCGVETERFAPAFGRTGRRIIAIGRLTAVKAPLLTLKAIAIAREILPDLTLDMIGDGPMREECKTEIARLGLSEAVQLHGACSHDTVQKLLARADLFVQHSITTVDGATESQGISLIEAMAAQLPVIATTHGGFPEIVVHGQTGYLVCEGDVAAMAERIIALATDPVLRRTMGHAAQDRARSQFDESILSARLRDYLSSFAEI